MKLKETGLEYQMDEATGTYIPKIKSTKRSEMSIGARRAIDMFKEMNYISLEIVVMSGLSDRIFEEIAQRATETHLRTRETLKNSGMNPTEIEAQADIASAQTMKALLTELRRAAATLSFRELYKWQLPPQ